MGSNAIPTCQSTGVLNIFGRMDVDLHKTVEFLRNSGVNVTVRNQEPPPTHPNVVGNGKVNQVTKPNVLAKRNGKGNALTINAPSDGKENEFTHNLPTNKRQKTKKQKENEPPPTHPNVVGKEKTKQTNGKGKGSALTINSSSDGKENDLPINKRQKTQGNGKGKKKQKENESPPTHPNVVGKEKAKQAATPIVLANGKGKGSALTINPPSDGNENDLPINKMQKTMGKGKGKEKEKQKQNEDSNEAWDKAVIGTRNQKDKSYDSIRWRCRNMIAVRSPHGYRGVRLDTQMFRKLAPRIFGNNYYLSI